MTCAICGASLARLRTHCVICGYARNPEDTLLWDRMPEAMMYEDLQSGMETEEPILAATRGRLAGSLRVRAAFSPQRLLTPYVNLGLTGQHLYFQHIGASDGKAIAKPIEIKLKTIRSITVAEADPIQPDRASRLVITFADSGDPVRVRLRAFGRMARSADALCKVWRTLNETGDTSSPAELICNACGRSLARAPRFCPFCGKPQGDE